MTRSPVPLSSATASAARCSPRPLPASALRQSPPRGRPVWSSIECCNLLQCSSAPRLPRSRRLPLPPHPARRDQAPRAEYVRFRPSFSRPRSYPSPAPPRSLPPAHPRPLLPPGRTDAVPPLLAAPYPSVPMPPCSSPLATFAGTPRLRCPSHGPPSSSARACEKNSCLGLSRAARIAPIPFEGCRSAPMTPYALMSPARPEVPRKGLEPPPGMHPGWLACCLPRSSPFPPHWARPIRATVEPGLSES
ncbi:hypothetical protein C8Q78DRAFT_489202 [Trametes maxima]|nr:hypothetical protein C8Q78DRAFT_489202 [Trametes maxima]